MRRLGMAVFGLLLLACEAGGEGGANLSHDPQACAAPLVPSSFLVRWRDLNHRVSDLRLQVTPPATEGCEVTELDASFIGGDFTTGDVAEDAPTLVFGYQRVEGEVTQLGAARVSIPVEFRQPGLTEGSLRLSRTELRLLGYEDVSAVIEGVAWWTDTAQGPDYPADYSPAHGYTSRGLGAGVELVALDEEGLTLSWWMRFAHGSSDRLNMNRAIVAARTEGRLDVLLLGTTGVPVAAGRVGYEQSHPEPVVLVPQELPPAPAALRELPLQGSPGAPRGLFGLASFDFQLAPERACRNQNDCAAGEACEEGLCSESLGGAGYYLREIGVETSLLGYDPATGEARFDVNGYVSNSSLIAFHALRYDFAAELLWLQVEGAGEPRRLEHEFTTGATQLPLP